MSSEGEVENLLLKLQRLEINNIKNVAYGTIDFGIGKTYDIEEKLYDSGITAIYGQNGSGKTVLVDCMNILKKLLSGDSLNKDLANYININESSCSIIFHFKLLNHSTEYNVLYKIVLIREKDNFYIQRESLSSSNGKNNRKNLLIDIEYGDELYVRPQRVLSKLKKVSTKSFMEFCVNVEMCREKQCSYLFSKRNEKILDHIFQQYEEKMLLKSLEDFGRYNLFVIQNAQNGDISARDVFPITFRIEDSNNVISGNLITMFSMSIIDEDKLNILENVIKQINTVTECIIPGLNIDLMKYGRSLSINGNIQVQIELISKKGDRFIPLRYESDGIKKLLSILSTLIAAYNNEFICVVIDEIDAGIFEYLLGELLKILDNNMKGQLIFTSHNLRILEKIRRQSIVFTTTNDKNRYIHLSASNNVKNLRDYYLRTISLGGEKEDIYAETNPFEISYALRKAGRIINGK